ncbi:MAG: S41 family peptidase [Gammaproteobacteria bacterium]|nr:S41 family peptidase [Gammaproteobacteria bacterium]
MKGISVSFFLAGVIAITGCGGDGASDDDKEAFGGALDSALRNDCSIVGQNVFVKDTLEDIYLYFDRLPDIDPGDFSSPEQLLEAVRFRELDSTFSFIADQATKEAFDLNSQFVGFGFDATLVSNSDFRVTQVFPGSPAESAGLARGFRILSIDGQTIDQLTSTNTLAAALGPAQIGFQVVFEIRDLADQDSSVTVSKAVVTIPPVRFTNVFDVGGTQVGYLSFRNFVEPAFDALDGAFAQLQQAGATELVLDLRYNGGGFISVANFLANLAGGNVPDGSVFNTFEFNEKNTDRNFELIFSNEGNALNLNRVIFITTNVSASASELVINGLDPFMDVVIIGDTTFGKPVGQLNFNFCDKTLVPVSFESKNADGVGGFFNGFAPTCPAVDDLTQPLGDPAEASLAEALNYVGTGACSVTIVKATQQLLQQKANVTVPQPNSQDGWRTVLGAY